MTSQDTTSDSPSSSERSPPAGGTGDPASRSRQPSPPRSLRRPRRRATHEPSAFRSFVVATRFRADADRCRTRANSIRFRPDRDGDGDEDCDAFASVAGDGGRMGDMDSGSLARYDNCSNVCFGDRQLASSLFQVANRGGDDDADDRLRGGDEGAGLEHWREASLVAMSFDTAEKAANTLSRYRERARSFDGGFLPSAQDPELHKGIDEESGLFVDSSDQRHPASGLTAPEMPSEDDRSGVFSQKSAGVESATSSVLWNHIDQSYHSHRRNRRSAPPASCREGKRLRKSAMHVARRVARGVAGLLVLAALLLYIAFEVDLESIEENLMERFSDNDNQEDNEEEAVAPSHLRSRKLPQEQVPVKNLAPVLREDQVVASLPKQRARERRESLRQASLQ